MLCARRRGVERGSVETPCCSRDTVRHGDGGACPRGSMVVGWTSEGPQPDRYWTARHGRCMTRGICSDCSRCLVILHVFGRDPDSSSIAPCVRACRRHRCIRWRVQGWRWVERPAEAASRSGDGAGRVGRLGGCGRDSDVARCRRAPSLPSLQGGEGRGRRAGCSSAGRFHGRLV